MMNAQQPQTAKEALKAMQVLFIALVAGMLMMGIVMIIFNLLEDAPLKDNKEFNQTILIVVLFVATILITISKNIFSNRIFKTRESGQPLMEKLNQYRSALIIYLALNEAAGFFALIAYFLTGNKLLLIVFVAVFSAMLFKRPEKSKIFNDLQLSSQEQLELN